MSPVAARRPALLAATLYFFGLVAYAQPRSGSDAAPSDSPPPSPAVRATFAATPEQAGIEPAPLDLRTEARALALVGGLLSLLPGSLGGDFALWGSARAPRMTLGWPLQVPLGAPAALLRPRGRRTAALSNHRVLLDPELLLGAWEPASEHDAAALRVGFRARVAYRYVVHPRGGAWGAVAGLGATTEFVPALRPAASVELGVRLGACCHEPAFVGALALRLDTYFVGPERLRLGASLGWSFY